LNGRNGVESGPSDLAALAKDSQQALPKMQDRIREPPHHS
jgi:hypothetical protein